LKSTHCLADFMRELKKASSAWIRDSRLPVFEWQEGYAAFSVSASSRDAVRQYISNQEAHHRVKSFRDELIEFLRKSDTDFNPRYLD
jgi:putative transposase